MSMFLAVADAVVSAVMLVVLLGAGGVVALLLPSAWRGR